MFPKMRPEKLSTVAVLQFIQQEFVQESSVLPLLLYQFFTKPKTKNLKYLEFLLIKSIRNEFLGIRHCDGENVWLDQYNNIIFYQFFRMEKSSCQKLVNILLSNDQYDLMTKQYRGGNFPVQPEKSILIFLWYMATQDSLKNIGYQFRIAASTVMKIVNVYLYLILCVKKKYIFWPKTDEEYEHILNGFSKYPGTLGAIDGSHIDLKVPADQHDSYVDRFQKHSINLMAICNAQKIFTYIFVGYPGCAHDSRVFSNSQFFQNIERFGPNLYFPNNTHIIGDSAFPIKPWLMVPFKRNMNLGPIETNHNYQLSSDRIVIENIFGLIKGRWRRTIFINTYSVSKAVEITTAACILHNFCYLNGDIWEEMYYEDQQMDPQYIGNNDNEARQGKLKRARIARDLFVSYYAQGINEEYK